MRFDRLRSALIAVLASVCCVAIGLAVCFLMLMLLAYWGLRSGGGAPALADVAAAAFHGGLKPLLLGGWAEGIFPGLIRAVPLMMAALSVAFAWRAGLYNLGAAGQYVLGAFGFVVCAQALQWPWYLCLPGAAVCGAVWGAAAGVLKARFGVHEAVSTLLLNMIGLYGVNALQSLGGEAGSLAWPVLPAGGMENPSAPAFLQPAAVALYLALAAALILWAIRRGTVFGYERKTYGSSAIAARYAGMNESKIVILSMAVAGLLAGLGGALYFTAGCAPWNPGEPIALAVVGFGGAAAAVLSYGHPLGALVCALFIAQLALGGSGLDAGIFPTETPALAIGVMVFLCAFQRPLMVRFGRRHRRKVGKEAAACS